MDSFSFLTSKGSWKLPGGLADPGESFADAAIRELREEVPSVGGAPLRADGVSSFQHTHQLIFGQESVSH